MVHTEKYARPEDLGRVVTNLQTDIQNLQVFETKGSQIYSYTPTWDVVSGTAPSLGNGTLTGHYATRGALIWCKVQLTYGSTSTGGSGNWTWSLPFPARTDMGVFVGAAFVDPAAAAGGYVAAAWLDPAVDPDVFVAYAEDPTDTAAHLAVQAGQPATWATSDRFVTELEYAPDWEAVEVLPEEETG
jgi:hypothetical protein